MTKTLLSTLAVFFIFCGNASAQYTKKAKEYWKKAQILRDSSHLDSALKLSRKALEIEENERIGKKKDTLFIADILYFIGDILKEQFDFDQAAYEYADALIFYGALGNKRKQLECLFKLNSCAQSAPLWYQESLPDWNKTNNENLDTVLLTYTKVKILEQTSDSVKVKFNMGRSHGVTEGVRAYLVSSSLDYQGPDREFTLAHGDVQTVDENTCTLWMLRNNSDTILSDDGGIINVTMAKRNFKGVVNKLLKYNIHFYTYFSYEYLNSREAIARFSDLDFESLILEAMLEDMHIAADSFRNRGLGLMDTIIDEGKFKGKTYYDAMKSIDKREIIYFLDYVYTYAGSYYNDEHYFVYKMVNWMVYDSNAPGDANLVLEPIFKCRNMEEIEREASLYGHYFKVFDKIDSFALDKYQKIALYENNKDSLLSLLYRLKKYAEWVDHSNFLSAVQVEILGILYDLKKYKEGLAEAESCYELGINKYTPAIYAGVFHSFLENEDLAISWLDSVLVIDSNSVIAIGYKGWQYTKKAKYTTAEDYCLKAWQLDSFEAWTNINLAHVYFLRNQKEEADRLYVKSLGLMDNINHYFTGLATDFDYFIKNGVQAEAFEELKKKYAQQFLNEYQIKLEADSMYDLGKRKYNQGKYLEAAPIFEQAAMHEETNPQVRYYTVRLYYNWSGFSYYKAENYKESIKRYLKAKEIAETKGLSDDVILEEILNVRNIYDWLGDTVAYRILSDKYEALNTAISEKQDRKKLYLISLGLNHSDPYGSGSEQDAIEIAEAFRVPASKYFDEVQIIQLTGKQLTLTALINAVDSAIITLEPNDIFMLYYNGPSYGQRLDHTLALNDYPIKTRELLGLLGQIQVRRQIHILDCNGTRWEELYDKEKFAPLASERTSLVFMGMNNARIPMGTEGRSALAAALLDAMSHPDMDGKISAGRLMSYAWHYLMEKQMIFPVRQYQIGHDIPLGIADVKINTRDSSGPKVEIYNATKLRDGTNISLVDRTKKELSGKVTDQSRVVVLTINGIKVKISENGRFSLPMDSVKGDVVEVFAADEYGFYSTSTYKVRQANLGGNQVATSGTRYAWIFATDTYDAWDDLVNPVHDAEKLASVLGNIYGYKVRLIVNNSRRDIRTKLDSIRRVHYKPGDQLFVFFAGHGHYDSIYGGYIVCKESEKPYLGMDYSLSYISQGEVANLLNDVSAPNVFLAMDVCYGGKMFDKQLVKPYFGSNTYNISDDEFIQRKLSTNCRQFLTSAGNEPALDGVVGANSPFANKLIEALESEAGKKAYITLFDIIGYMGKIPTQPRYGPFGSSHPDGEYLFKVVNKPTVIGVW